MANDSDQNQFTNEEREKMLGMINTYKKQIKKLNEQLENNNMEINAFKRAKAKLMDDLN